MRHSGPLAGAALALAVGMAPAQAAVIYTQGFEGGSLPAEFTGGTVESKQGFAAGGDALFLRNDADGNPAAPTTLSLAGIAAHTSITLRFELYVLDTWDGRDPDFGPDLFNVTVGGNPLLQAAYLNVTTDPSGEAGTRFAAGDLFNGPCTLEPELCQDSAYLVELTFAHSDPTLQVQFFASGENWQGGGDESWAIDNLVVETASAIPEPAGLLLLGIGLFGLAALRRR